MKKTIKSFLVAAAALFAFSACTEVPALDDLEGKYPEPDNYTMNSLLFEERIQGESVHNFNLIVATEGLTLEGEAYAGSGAALSLKLLDNKSTLTTQSYTAATADKAKKGNYIIGEGGSQLLVVENGTVTPKNIVSGEVIVTIFQEQYNLYGTLWLADESIAKFDATIDLPNHGDLLVKTKLTKVLSVANNQNGSLTINLGTSKVESAPNAYGGVDMTGEGNYLALDIYTPDGFLYEGTYTPSAQGGAIGAGEYGIGWDPGDLWGIGMVFENWGTCWWTIGTPNTAVKILEGNIEVTKKGGKYTISYLNGDIWFEFTGAIADVDPDGGDGGNTDTDTTEYTELTKLMSAQSNVPNAPSLTINMASADLEWEYNAATWSNEFKTDGYYLAMDIYSTDGKLYTGSYVANTVGGELAEGQFGIGYDTTIDFGFGPMEMKDWGTCWWNVEGGVATAEKVLDGTVTVLVEGDNLVIKLLSEVVNAKFTCPVADFKDGNGNAIEVVNNAPATPEEPEFEGEELTQLMSAQSNVANGAPSLTINMASADLEWEYNTATWSNEFKTDGYYLAMDIYSADGKLYTGTYEANSEGGVLAEGQFGIGYDTTIDFGFGPMEMKDWGTCWWNVESGVATAEKVLDGTVEVEVKGENLVITLESEVVNAQFIYPIADFKDGNGNAIEVVNGVPSVPETPDTPVVPSEPEDDDTEYIELSILTYAGVNPGSVSLNMATEGWSVEYLEENGGAPTYSGEGFYLSTDLYSADGKIHTGSYVANTVGGVLAEGQFGIGYDKPEWNGYNWGTCWWTVADGAATPVKVDNGEMDVLVVGENLVIKFRSTIVNAKFTCPVANIKNMQGNAIEVI